MKVMISVILFLLLVESVVPHYRIRGNCPNVTAVSSFEPSKFIGKWYVHKQVGSTFYCTTYTIKETDDGFEVSVIKEPPTNKLSDFKIQVLDSAIIKGGSDGTLSEMTITWPNHPLRFLPSAETKFILTSLNATGEYASIVECQSWSTFLGAFSRIDLIILSRQKSLSADAIKEIEDIWDGSEVDKSASLPIDQSSCSAPDEVDYVIDSNNPTDRFSDLWQRIQSLVGSH